MKSRFFWETRSLKKFRIIFESDEIIVGADRRNKYRTFRKDTGVIGFSRREVLEMRFACLTKKQKLEAENNDSKNGKTLRNSALRLNFG